MENDDRHSLALSFAEKERMKERQCEIEIEREIRGKLDRKTET